MDFVSNLGLSIDLISITKTKLPGLASIQVLADCSASHLGFSFTQPLRPFTIDPTLKHTKQGINYELRQIKSPSSQLKQTHTAIQSHPTRTSFLWQRWHISYVRELAESLASLVTPYVVC